MWIRKLLPLALIVLFPPGAETQGGEVIYQTLCAACHTNPPDENIPRIDSLRLLDADTIVDTLTSGTMRLQGQAMSPEQHVQVAEYIAGAPLGERAARFLSQGLIGSWILVSAEGRGNDGTVTLRWGPEPVGRLILDDGGRMSVHFLNPDRRLFASGDFLRSTPEELKEAFDGYFGYFGAYTVDEEIGTVTFHVEGAAYPNYVGTAQQRSVLLEEDRLTLRTPPVRAGGADVTYEMVWERKR